ncbi:MAG: hypothetical protein FWG77_04950 [Treponema sp.]|nr:hypothetical protein [Treponema sp.]
METYKIEENKEDITHCFEVICSGLYYILDNAAQGYSEYKPNEHSQEVQAFIKELEPIYKKIDELSKNVPHKVYEWDFIDTDMGDPSEIVHLDGNKANNSLNNLAIKSTGTTTSTGNKI